MEFGEELTAVTGGIADADGLTPPVAYAYQWIRVGAQDTDIAAATSSTYTIAEADLGKALKVRVSFADDLGNAETLTSDATGTVPWPPVPNLAATPAKTTLAVTWSAVSNATEYIVLWKSGEEFFHRQLRGASVPASGRSHTIGGLKGGTEYTVRVEAARFPPRRAGMVIAISEITTTTLSPELGAVSITQTGATLTVAGHTAAWHYKRTEPAPGNCSPAQTSTSAQLDGLTAGTRYTYTTYSDDPCTAELASVTFATAGAPEIAVEGNGLDIADGKAMPSSSDHTDFGAVVVAGAAARSRTFTVRNTGTASLSLSGSPSPVTVSGAHAVDFTVSAQPASSSVAPGGSTTFTVTFDPSATGTRAATLELANNDSDKNPFDFAIRGTGANEDGGGGGGSPPLDDGDEEDDGDGAGDAGGGDGDPPKAAIATNAVCGDGLCRALSGVPVRFEDTSTGFVRFRRWDFGDGGRRTSPTAVHSWPAPGFHTVVLWTSNGNEESTASLVFLVQAADPDGTCEPDPRTLCLRNSRYAVSVNRQTANGESVGATVVHAGTNDTGLFRFFDAANWEVLIKILDACALNGHVWVYAGSTTNLGYTIRVTDTQDGVVRDYDNAPGLSAPAITDARAFSKACEP